jgi:hypothetical protein
MSFLSQLSDRLKPARALFKATAQAEAAPMPPSDAPALQQPLAFLPLTTEEEGQLFTSVSVAHINNETILQTKLYSPA